MNATNNEGQELPSVRLVDTETLKKLLSLGRKSAVDIGLAANAKVIKGRRVVWNLRRIDEYLDSL